MQGIFRLAPDPNVALAVERELEKGCLQPGHPPEVLAHLIKSFMRRLPGGLLGRVPMEKIENCVNTEGALAMLECLAPHARSLLEWLVRVIVEVAEYKEENSMGLRNLTLVIAPNLLVTGPSEGGAGEPCKKKGTWISRKAHGHGAAKKNERESGRISGRVINPLEELANIESASNALYMLCNASVRVRL